MGRMPWFACAGVVVGGLAITGCQSAGNGGPSATPMIGRSNTNGGWNSQPLAKAGRPSGATQTAQGHGKAPSAPPTNLPAPSPMTYGDPMNPTSGQSSSVVPVQYVTPPSPNGSYTTNPSAVNGMPVTGPSLSAPALPSSPPSPSPLPMITPMTESTQSSAIGGTGVPTSSVSKSVDFTPQVERMPLATTPRVEDNPSLRSTFPSPVVEAPRVVNATDIPEAPPLPASYGKINATTKLPGMPEEPPPMPNRLPSLPGSPLK